MIYKIPKVSINGSGGENQRPIFGGYIYSLDYTPSMGDDSPSSIVINLISENGEYTVSKSDLNLTRVYNIAIGSKLAVPMYLKRYKKIISPNGNLLELEFIDGSFVLDRTIVGLHKRYGNNPKYIDKNLKTFGDTLDERFLIIVGREYHPCDKDYDGEMDKIEDLTDLCHPCNQTANIDARHVLVNCEEETKYNILEVKYNFTELIEGIERAGIKVRPVKDPNPKYLATYEGTLREVLSGWCADFGWTFFWEKETLVFMDLRSVINVNTAISNFCPNLEEYTEEYTLDGTVQTALITNYNRQGESSNYITCQDAIYLTVPVYNQTNYPTPNLKVTELIDETAASLCYYSVELRQLWYYFSKYGIRKAEDVVPQKHLKELGLKFITQAIKLKNAPAPVGNALSQMSDPTSHLESKYLRDYIDNRAESDDAPIDFMSVDVSYNSYLQAVQRAIEEDEIFQICFNQLQADLQWKVVENINQKYFFVGYWNEEIEARYVEQERDYASNFYNKFHIFTPNMGDPRQREFFENFKFIEDDSSCNSNRRMKKDGKLTYQLNGDPGGVSMEYFNNPGIDENGDIQTLRDMPFSRFLSIVRNSKLEDPASSVVRDFKLVCLSKNSSSYFPEAGATEPDDEDNPPKHRINNAKLLRDANSYYPVILESVGNDRGENVATVILNELGMAIPDEDRNRIAIFLGTEVEDTEFIATKSNAINQSVQVGIPHNGAPLNPNDDPENPHTVVYQYPELKCMPVGNLSNTSIRLDFKTPVSTFYLFEPGNAPYAIVLEKTKQVKRAVPKIESVFVSAEEPKDTVLEYDVNYQNVSDDYIKVLTRENEFNTCLYDTDLIQNIQEEFVKNLAMSQTEPLLNLDFTVGGIDINGPEPSIENGLQGIKITVDDSGVKTNYKFGTSKMLKPNKLEVYSLLSRNTKINSSQSFPNSITRPE